MVLDPLRSKMSLDLEEVFVERTKIAALYADAEQLTERILHEARVFITSGFIFGSNGRRYVRISLCTKDEKMAEACNRIAALKW